MGQFSMKICPQVGQFLMELNMPAPNLSVSFD
jgi:hypothetical protein